MPLYDFQCSLSHVTEMLLTVEHENVQVCPVCGYEAKQLPSAPTFRFAGRPVLNDYDDPWEGTPLAGQGEPDVLRYKSDKIFIDQNKASGRRKPVDYAQRIAEAQPP